MPRILIGDKQTLDLKDTANQCYVAYRDGRVCPNEFTYVIEDLTPGRSPGFMKCCKEHCVRFLELDLPIYFNHLSVLVYTRQEWEDSGREKELLARMKRIEQAETS